jgi:hypothetical protein
MEVVRETNTTSREFLQKPIAISTLNTQNRQEENVK